MVSLCPRIAFDSKTEETAHTIQARITAKNNTQLPRVGSPIDSGGAA
jgi:hypothetical protein